MSILVTGCAGFIGYHLCEKLLIKSKKKIYGIDNLNNYYDLKLKKSRLVNLSKNKKFNFKKIDITNNFLLNNYIKKHKIKFIIHLAAQAGVRHSIKNPKAYFESNLLGFFNILESARSNNIKHLIFASTSSVYGNSNDFPLSEKSNSSNPLSFYAATKKSNEVMAHSYSNIFKLPSSGLRFFTVYGPYGRPDMALFKFSEAIIKSKFIDLYNNGNHTRDFTYIDDVVESIIKIIHKIPKNNIPFEIYNVGNSHPQKLRKFLKEIELNLNKKSKKNLLKIQAGDVVKTHANINKIAKLTNFRPEINIKEGIKNFIEWYKKYYKSK